MGFKAPRAKFIPEILGSKLLPLQVLETEVPTVSIIKMRVSREKIYQFSPGIDQILQCIYVNSTEIFQINVHGSVTADEKHLLPYSKTTLLSLIKMALMKEYNWASPFLFSFQTCA